MNMASGSSLYRRYLSNYLSEPLKLIGERRATVRFYKSPDVCLGEKDMDLITKVITTNHNPGEGRSIFLALNDEYRSKDIPFGLNLAQIKGVKFDTNKKFKQYCGVGVCPLYYYADKDGKLNKIENLKSTTIINGSRVGKDAVGTMDLQEAEKEFFLTIHFISNKLDGVYVKYPLAVGKFENIKYDNGYLGFEVLLTNKDMLDRTKDYVEALVKGDDDIAIKIIKKRAAVLKTLHFNGCLAPFLTLDNLQIFARKSWVLLHDIGDSRFLCSKYSPIPRKAFMSESFWNLCYIMQHNRTILPGACGYDISMDFLGKNEDRVFSANMLGYFGRKIGNRIISRYGPKDFQLTLTSLITYGQRCATPLFKDFVRFFHDT